MVKTELREQVSGHSCVSDVESDSDSPTEVNIWQDQMAHYVIESHSQYRAT